MKKVTKLSISLKRISSGMFSTLSVSPTVQLGGTGALVAAVSASPAGTENGLITRNIPFGTQTISGTVGLGNSANTIGLVKMTDGTNTTAVLNSAPSSDTGQSAVAVRVVSQLGAGGLAADNTGFTLGVSTFLPHGGVFNDTLAALGSGQQGTARLTTYRAFHANLRDASGLEKATAANPNYDTLVSSNGTKVVADVHGYLQVRERSSVLFYDSMPTATLDANRWSTALSLGTVVQSVESIAVSAPASTSAFAQLFSAATFSPQGAQEVLLDGLVFLPSAVSNGPTFFFGFGNKQTTPTSAIPVLDGIGFSSGANSNINGTIASIYANGVLKYSSVVTSFAVLNAWNRYRITWSGNAAYFYLNDMDTPVASLTGALPVAAGFTSNAMSPLFVTVTPTTTAAAGTMNIGPMHVGDMGRNNLQISDGNYPWRQLTISNYTSGTTVYGQVVTVEQKDTNRTNFSAYNAGVTPTAVLTLVSMTPQRGGVSGSAATSLQAATGKTLRITSVALTVMNSATTASSCRIFVHLINTGAVTTTSPIIGNCACNTSEGVAATANYCGAGSVSFPDGIEISGSMQFGISLQGVASGTAYVLISAVEY